MRALLLAAALALLLGAASAQPQLTEGLLKDREALLALKNACTSYGQAKLASWRPTGNPCFPKPWAHVTCRGGRVAEINLANRQVVGVLPGKLRLAQDLVTLNLEGNKFTGNISDAWAGKNSFTKLKTLNLANNDLSGTLPNWNRLGAWRSLETLDLSNNKFYGGLPTNWLGKQKPLRNVRYLDLSNNRLGYADATTTTPLAKSAWCPNKGTLSAGSGWCPDEAPIVGTAASLVSLDLSNNGFEGAIPTQWPSIFTRLQYLELQFNKLYSADDKHPAALPELWSSPQKRGFPALSMLTLYPGNDLLCSIPSVDGGFQDVNLDATYQIADANEVMYTNDNPRLCPTPGISDNNPVTSVTLDSKSTATIEWSYDANKPIWGFKVTLWAKDTEGGEWTPLPNWNAVLLRTYTGANDGFDAAAMQKQGLPATLDGIDTWDFAAASLTAERLLPVPDLSAGTDLVSRWKLTVSVVNLDGVESTEKSGELANN